MLDLVYDSSTIMLRIRNVQMVAGASPASRDRGGGAKFKSGGQRFSPAEFFWLKSQIFPPKAVDLQKKKVFAEIRRLFLAEIAIFNVFSAQKQQLLPPKKIPWGARKKSRGGGKNENQGGIAPLPPRWRRAWMVAFIMLPLRHGSALENIILIIQPE